MTDHRPALMCLSNTVANLAQRMEALEGKYETMRLATLEWGKALDRHDRWIDEHLKRIMALEAEQKTKLSPAVDPVRDLQDQIRDGSLTLAEALEAWQQPNYPEIPDSSPAPYDSLVERLASRLRDLTGADDDPIDLWHDEARAAIREVAAALIDWHDSDEVVRTAWEAAKWLQREANQ